MTDYYTNKSGVRIAIRPSTSRQPLGDDHMSVFARLASVTNMHGTPGQPHGKKGKR